MDQAISDTRYPVKTIHFHQAADDSSRALRAASQETPRPEHTLLSCPRCDAVWAFWPKGYGDDPQPFMNVRSKTWCGWCERANASELVPAEYVSVPARADLGMVDAAIRCSNEWSRGLTDFASLYRAMLEAAPRPPVQCDGRDGVTDSAASSEAAKPLASNEQDGNADCPPTMVLNYEPHNGRSFWHSDCVNHFGGMVREVKREEGRSLMECLHCGQRGYYKFGWVGPHTVPIEGAEARDGHGKDCA